MRLIAGRNFPTFPLPRGIGGNATLAFLFKIED